MIFSGYQLGVHILNATDLCISTITKDIREEIVKKNIPIVIEEFSLNNKKGNRNALFFIKGVLAETIVAKQIKNYTPNCISTLENENYIYELFKHFGINNKDLFIGYDASQKLLFTKYIETKTLSKNRLPTQKELSDLVQKIASNLNEVHAFDAQLLKQYNYPDRFGYRKPLILTNTKRDWEDTSKLDLNPIQTKFIELLSDKEYYLFDIIKKNQNHQWQFNNLIHFDLKFENFLNNDTKGFLIDWEMADLGDIHWDIASIWYEIIAANIYENAEIDQIIEKSIVVLNEFFKIYNKVIDTNKLQFYLGLVLLEKFYYGFINNLGVTLGYSSEWLKFAVDLINGINLVYINAPDYTTNIPINRIPNTTKEYPTDEIINAKKAYFGTGKIIDELVDNLPSDYKTKSINDLEQWIYGWFNGSFENDLSLIKKEIVNEKTQIGEQQLANNQKFVEDKWWKVEERFPNGSLAVRKQSEKRLAVAGEFIFAKSDARFEDSYISLFYPNYIVRANDAKQDSKDLWILSDTHLRQDYANWVRFYFHLTNDLEGINTFIQQITEKLNERCIPFHLKLRNSLSSYYRSDVAILFIHRNNFNASLDSIAYVHKILTENSFLRESTPKFTKNFSGAIGLAMAENPTNGNDSFGMSRAKILTEIIKKSNAYTIDELKEEIKVAVYKLGYNVYEFYRNAYPKETEYKYRFDKIEKLIKNPPNLNYDLNATLKYLPKQKYLQAARKLGFILCKEAIWYGDNCSWFSFKKEGNRSVFKNLDENELWGVGLFLSALAIYCKSETIFLDCAKGILYKYFEGRDQDGISKIELSPIYSNTPYEIFLLFINKIKKAKIELPKIETSVLGLYDSEFLANNSINSKLFADNLIENFINKNIPLPNKYSLNWGDNLGLEFNPTISHGIAGFGYFLIVQADKNLNKIKPLSEIYIIK